MIAVDTNILVRLLTRDDEAQYKKAFRLFEKENIFIPETVLLETEWVLRWAYHFEAGQINRSLAGLLGLPNVQTRSPSVVQDALVWHAEGMDFADALHLAASGHCKGFKTFDKAFAKKAGKCPGCRVTVP